MCVRVDFLWCYLFIHSHCRASLFSRRFLFKLVHCLRPFWNLSNFRFPSFLFFSLFVLGFSLLLTFFFLIKFPLDWSDDNFVDFRLMLRLLFRRGIQSGERRYGREGKTLLEKYICLRKFLCDEKNKTVFDMHVVFWSGWAFETRPFTHKVSFNFLFNLIQSFLSLAFYLISQLPHYSSSHRVASFSISPLSSVFAMLILLTGHCLAGTWKRLYIMKLQLRINTPTPTHTHIYAKNHKMFSIFVDFVPRTCSCCRLHEIIIVFSSHRRQ